jgi:hypothetical protein
MGNVTVDDEDSDFATEDLEQLDDVPSGIKEGIDARRRIEELMERRHLKGLIDDPYSDDVDEEL